MSWQVGNMIDEGRDWTRNTLVGERGPELFGSRPAPKAVKMCPMCKKEKITNPDWAVCGNCLNTVSAKAITDFIDGLNNPQLFIGEIDLCQYCGSTNFPVRKEPFGGELACEKCWTWLLEAEDAKDLMQEMQDLDPAWEMPPPPKCPCGGGVRSLEPASQGMMRVQCELCGLLYVATTDLQTITLTKVDE